MTSAELNASAQEDILRSIAACFSRAIHERLSHDEIWELMLRAMRGHHRWGKLEQYRKASCSAAAHATIEALRGFRAYLHRSIDGDLVDLDAILQHADTLGHDARIEYMRNVKGVTVWRSEVCEAFCAEPAKRCAGDSPVW